MKVTCIGAGYVGGPSMAVLAARCPHITVTVVDINANRIAAWNSDSLPIYEPGLQPLVKSCLNRNLFFDTDISTHVAEADIIFISVNTPTKVNGVGKGKAADLTYLERSARLIARVSKSDKIVVEKSTVPVRAADTMASVLRRNRHTSTVHFEILSNPEFLSEGNAIEDLLNPDRVLIGGQSTESGKRAIQKLKSMYQEWIPEDRILSMSLWSAELSKLTANALLAQRVSSINSISALCETTGADIKQVAQAVGMDTRIGSKFLEASVGFGGSCFQKDLLNLVYICESLGLNQVAEYWNQVLLMNDYQKSRFVHRVVSSMFNTLTDKKLAVFGFSFKKNTSDTRFSPAIDVCHGLMNDGAQLAIYDPKVSEKQIRKDLFPDKIELADAKQVEVVTSPYEACKDADAICLLTDWDEFRQFDFESAYSTMRKPAYVFDGRNTLDLDRLKQIGYVIYGIGKPLDAFYHMDRCDA
eukprot:g5408.t1